MTKSQSYVVDSDVFITAKNAYYAFDFCPGFWDAVLQGHKNGRVHSIDRVKAELLAGRPTEDLVKWVKAHVPVNFFHDTGTTDIAKAYGEIGLWVQKGTQYFDAAKAKFFTGADGWLVAYSMVHGTTVVTNEQSRPEARNEIKLPDVCNQFKVLYENTFELLRQQSVQLELGGKK